MGLASSQPPTRKRDSAAMGKTKALPVCRGFAPMRNSMARKLNTSIGPSADTLHKKVATSGCKLLSGSHARPERTFLCAVALCVHPTRPLVHNNFHDVHERQRRAL